MSERVFVSVNGDFDHARIMRADPTTSIGTFLQQVAEAFELADVEQGEIFLKNDALTVRLEALSEIESGDHLNCVFLDPAERYSKEAVTRGLTFRLYRQGVPNTLEALREYLGSTGLLAAFIGGVGLSLIVSSVERSFDVQEHSWVDTDTMLAVYQICMFSGTMAELVAMVFVVLFLSQLNTFMIDYRDIKWLIKKWPLIVPDAALVIGLALQIIAILFAVMLTFQEVATFVSMGVCIVASVFAGGFAILFSASNQRRLFSNTSRTRNVAGSALHELRPVT